MPSSRRGPRSARMRPELLAVEWEAPAHVGAAMSTRRGGVSAAPFDSLNLRPVRLRVDASDGEPAVVENERRFVAAIGAAPVWLDQVHRADVVRIDRRTLSRAPIRADASISTEPGIACAVLVADCLPVLMCGAGGRAVAAAHAGWRGLAAGVLENTLGALCEAASCAPAEVAAWLGPCIGPRQFEVGADVLAAFAADAAFFVSRPRADGSPRWLDDLPGLARAR